MTKKLTILLLCLFFSCSNTNTSTIKTEVSTKNSTSTSNTLTMESEKNPLSNLDGLLKLKAEFKLNDSNRFIDGYFDDNNNAIIFLDNKTYYINGKSEIITSDFETKIGILTNPIFDKDGNGFADYSTEVTTGMIPDVYTFKRFENFLPKETVSVKNQLPDLMQYFRPKLINNIGFYYQLDTNSFYTFIVDKNNTTSVIEKIELDKKTQIYNTIFDKNNNGFVVTKEEGVDNKVTQKLYLYKKNKLDLTSSKIIDFDLGNSNYYIDGQINENGNGYIYSLENNFDLKLKKVLNYNILDELIIFDNIQPSLQDKNSFKLDSNGNGFIISSQEKPNLFLYEIKNYKKTNNKYLLASNLDKKYREPIYAINSSGNGFIIITTYKNLTTPLTFPLTYNNEMIIINNYKIVK